MHECYHGVNDGIIKPLFCCIWECWLDPLDFRRCDVVSWVIVRESLWGEEAEVVVMLGIHRGWCTERVCDNHGGWVIDLFQVCVSCCLTGVVACMCPACVGGLVC